MTSNVFFRTFFVKFEAYGTAFTIDHKGKEYLVTAKHLLNIHTDHYSVNIYLQKKWNSFPLELVGHGRGDLDVSVFRFIGMDRFVPEEYPLSLDSSGIFVGQDMFFAGFPYKMHVDYGEELFGNRPGAFIKKGTISSFNSSDQTLYLDAINNEGFSGGPIFYRPNDGSVPAKVVGVVSRFREESERVIDSKGEFTGEVVKYNTGFLIGTFDHVVASIIDTQLKN